MARSLLGYDYDTLYISDSFLSNSTYQVARQRLQTRKKGRKRSVWKISPFDASVRSAMRFHSSRQILNWHSGIHLAIFYGDRDTSLVFRVFWVWERWENIVCFCFSNRGASRSRNEITRVCLPNRSILHVLIHSNINVTRKFDMLLRVISMRNNVMQYTFFKCR